MGSPGAFIHSGTFGGRLDGASSARACPAARPLITAPPSNALPSPNICRRDGARFALALPTSVALVAISPSAPGGDGFSEPLRGLETYGHILAPRSTPTGAVWCAKQRSIVQNPRPARN